MDSFCADGAQVSTKPGQLHYARAEDAERALRAGYQEHFAKPVDATKLLQAVKLWSQARSTAM